MEEQTKINTVQEPLEGIDLNKLKVIIKSNWYWIILILFVTNFTAFLVIRYTQDLFESSSELKLDVKKDASELGFNEFVDRSPSNLISGEIEIIQSKSFLSHVVDSLNLHVSYYSIGKFLNTELYRNSPFRVQFEIKNPRFFNTPITIVPKDNDQFELRFENGETNVTGNFNDTLRLDGLNLWIEMTAEGSFEPGITYSFVLNSRESLIDYISRNLTVEPLKLDANTIRITFKDNNPMKARDLVNGIDSLYLAYSNRQKNQTNKQKIEWLNSELQNIESRMESYENYFEDFILENRTSNLEQDLAKTIVLINAIDSQRFEITRRISDTNQLIDVLATQSKEIRISNRTFYPDYLNKNVEMLQQLDLEMDKMKMSYNESTFAYRQKKNQTETIRKQTIDQLTDLRNDWMKLLQELNQRKVKLENDFAGMPDKNTQFSKKQRFYQLYEEFYLSLLQSRSQFELAQAGSTPDFKILATANLPGTPISPNRLMIYGIGFVAGIVLSFFFIGVVYLANDKINSLSEIERLCKVPLLGVVPALRRSNGSDIYIISHPKSMVSEAIRTLRTNLDFFKTESAQKVIVISSTVSGEGKSFIAMNLGAIMSLSNKKVVLLDLDMRKQKINTYFSATAGSSGISTILIGKNSWQESLLKSPLENFDFIPSGPHPPNPAELLLSDEFRNLLDDLKKHYDYILMDTPPVGVVTDGIMAMKQADISIYILRAHYSKKDFINNLHRIVRINKFQNITTVLNALPSNPDTTYGYGYYEEEKKSWARSILKRSV